MDLSQVDRMSAVILAKTIVADKLLLDLKNELNSYVKRLHAYRIFTVGELAEIAGLSEYKIHKILSREEEFRAKSGVNVRHLDHLLRMIPSYKFAKLHVKSLIDDGATIAGISRVSGISESSLRRWSRGDSNE